MNTPKRKAPWADFAGADIYEGDCIEHPFSRERGVVCFWPQEKEPSDQWRVFYAKHGAFHSRLCLQIGEKGQAVVVPPGDRTRPRTIWMTDAEWAKVQAAPKG